MFAPITAAHDLWLAARARGILRRLAREPVERVMVIDPEKDIPIRILRQLQRIGTPHHPHPVIRGLTNFLIERPAFEATVPLQAVNAVMNSKGELHMTPDALPETMHLSKDETFGPLSEDEMTRLRDAVWHEFPAREGRFDLWLQEWDGLLIASNSGASRRFCLWRRLSRFQMDGQTLPARVRPFALDTGFLDLIRRRYRLVLIGARGPFAELVADLARLWPECAFHRRASDCRHGVVVIPNPRPGICVVHDQLADLHAKLDACFDLGRYLAERTSMARVPRSGWAGNGDRLAKGRLSEPIAR